MSKTPSTHIADPLIRLNRFIANSGVCTRREADTLIKEGRITVNEQVVTLLGSKVHPHKDIVQLDGKRLTGKPPVDLLINKGPGIPSHRSHDKNIFSLVGAQADDCQALDPLPPDWRGLVVLTNRMASYQKKDFVAIYLLRFNEEAATPAYELCKELKRTEEVILALGEQRDDGSFGITLGKSSPGVLKSLLGPHVKGLEYVDRVSYGGLNKKDLPRGRWRVIEESESTSMKRRH